ncbi:MAG: hypothetical protein ACYTEX_14240 [Planctomycetota bacterium]
MCKKIVLAVPLVLVLALAVSVRTSVPGKVALTDAQMSSVYGGAKCRYYDMDGCDPVYCFGDCSYRQEWWDAGCEDPNLPNNCSGGWWTTCKQAQRWCSGGGSGCTETTPACLGTFDAWSCGLSPPPEHECELNYDATYFCQGSKLWCYDN